MFSDGKELISIEAARLKVLLALRVLFGVQDRSVVIDLDFYLYCIEILCANEFLGMV